MNNKVITKEIYVAEYGDKCFCYFCPNCSNQILLRTKTSLKICDFCGITFEWEEEA